MAKRELARQLVQFGAVGGAGFGVDVLTFNFLTFTVLSTHSVPGGPVWAKLVSTSLAIVTNWLGNRAITFRSSRRPDVMREGVEFAMVSLAGGLIAIACLGVSHYGLGLTSRFADNVAANVIGLALGSLFRFTVYRNWVYSKPRGVPRR